MDKKKNILVLLGGLLVIAIAVSVIFFTQKKPPVTDTDSSTTNENTVADITAEMPTEEKTDDNGDVKPDGSGLTLDGSNVTVSSTAPVKAETPAKPATVVKPNSTAPSQSGSIDIGNAGNEAVYSCKTPHHNCENADYHAGLVAREKKGCPYCSSHSCPSFYAVNKWGYTIYDPTVCPKYNAHNDANEYCQTCGKKCGDGRNGTCVTFNVDIKCPNCGKQVEAWHCHTCK